MTHPKALALLLGFIMATVGVTGISYEYSFSKLASDVLGDPIRQWAITIGLMMACMGLGADWQKRVKDHRLGPSLVEAQLLLGLLGGLGPGLSLWFFGNAHDFFLPAHYLLVSLVGFLIGLEIPLITRLNETQLPSLKENLGWILKMDYLGSFVGALLWVLVLPLWFDFLQVGLFLGMLNALVALLAWGLFCQGRAKPHLGLILLTLVTLGGGLVQSKPLQIALEQKLYSDPIVFTASTPYQRLVMTRRKTGEVRLYINGHLQFSSADEGIYHEILVHSVLGLLPEAKRVLVLGGGDGLAVRELLKYPQLTEITLVDLDPAMTKLAATQPDLVRLNQGSLQQATILNPQGVSPGERVELSMQGQGFFRRKKEVKGVVRLMNLDANRFVHELPGSWDAVILDFPDPNSPSLSKLYSLEFYQALKEKLNPGGLMIQQSTSPAFAKEAFLLIGRTLRAAGFETLPLHQAIPSFGDWGFWLAGDQAYYGPGSLQRALRGPLKLPPGLRQVDAEVIRAAGVFRKEGLKSASTKINKILEDQIFPAYRAAWLKGQ